MVKQKKKRKKMEGAFPECLGTWHSGKDKLKKGQGLPRVPWHLALGEGKIKKKTRGFPECLGNWHSGKSFSKKTNFFPECNIGGRG
jgi:hypothetical protein